MAQLFITVIGHNASGKTTLAKKLEAELGLNRVNGDDFRDFIAEHITYFKDLDRSYPTELGTQLGPLTISYRLDLARILLSNGQNIIFDGSGFTKASRHPLQDLLAEFPTVKNVIIYVKLPETELIKRLEARGKHWIKMYNEIRKTGFEPPTAADADVLIEYDQTNYEKIAKTLKNLL